MSRSKKTRTALLVSILALLFSVMMMVGSTFAWFTDSASSGVNKITTGKLNVELFHQGMQNDGKVKVEQDTVLFTDEKGDPVHWEPGAMTYENFTIKNQGELALKYRLALNMGNENTIIGIDKSLKDVIKVKVVEGGVTKDDLEDLEKDTAFATVSGDSYPISEHTNDGVLQPSETATTTYGVILYWQPDEENDYQYNLENYEADGKGYKTSDGKEELSVDLGITLAATQAIGESDSMGEDYDKSAKYPATTTEELRDAIANAESGATIDLTGSFFLEDDLHINKDITLASSGGAVISGGSVIIGESCSVTLRNITCKEPGGEASCLYATGFMGKLTLENCKFADPQDVAVALRPATGAEIIVKGCTFSISEQAKNRAKDRPAGARWLEIETTDGADTETILLTMTDNRFVGGGWCTGDGISVYGIPKSRMKLSGNQVDDSGEVWIRDGKTEKFVGTEEFTQE